MQPSAQVKQKILGGALTEDVEEDGLKVVVHEQNDDSDASAEDHEFNGCIRTIASINLTLSNDRVHLGVGIP